jgi:hypothetical protein
VRDMPLRSYMAVSLDPLPGHCKQVFAVRRRLRPSAAIAVPRRQEDRQHLIRALIARAGSSIGSEAWAPDIPFVMA